MALVYPNAVGVLVPINIPRENANILWGGTAVPTSQRPVLAAWLGVFAAEWGSLESSLAHLFAAVLRIDGRVATGILDRILSTRQKINVVKFAVESLVDNEAARQPLIAAVKRAETLSAKRNEMIHGRWGVSDAHPDHLIWQKNTFEPNLPLLGYDESDFRREIRKVNQTQNDITNAVFNFYVNLVPP